MRLLGVMCVAIIAFPPPIVAVIWRFLATKYSLLCALICAKTALGKCESTLSSVMILSLKYLSKTAFRAFLRVALNGIKLHKNCKIALLVRKSAYSSICASICDDFKKRRIVAKNWLVCEMIILWIALRESAIRLEMRREMRLYFLRKQNEAKTFIKIRTSCGLIFVWIATNLLRKFSQ